MWRGFLIGLISGLCISANMLFAQSYDARLVEELWFDNCLRFAVEGVEPLTDFMQLPITDAEYDSLDIPNAAEPYVTAVALLQRRYLAFWAIDPTDVPTRYCTIRENKTDNYKPLKIDVEDLHRFQVRAQSEGMTVAEGLDDLGPVGIVSFREFPEFNYLETRMTLVHYNYSNDRPWSVSVLLAASPSLVGPGS